MGIEKLKVDCSLSSDVISLIQDLGLSKSIDKNIKTSIAIALFTSKSVSLARAAEISEHSLGDFIFLLKNKNIPWGEYTENELRLDEAFVNDYMEEEDEDNEGSSM
jgi:predicted HTH domain antitoxin